MTVAELYRCDSTVQMLVDCWVQERRCPLPLADRLLELDQPDAADAALWAATEPDRPVYEPVISAGERGGFCGPYPTKNNSTDPKLRYWFWAACTLQVSILYACDLPKWRINGSVENVKDVANAPTDLLLWLLDHWQPDDRVAAAGGSEYTTSGGGRR